MLFFVAHINHSFPFPSHRFFFSPTLVYKASSQDNIEYNLHSTLVPNISHAYILHHALLNHSPCFRCCCSCKFHRCLVILTIFVFLCHIQPGLMMASKINPSSSTLFSCLSLSSCDLENVCSIDSVSNRSIQSSPNPTLLVL